MERVVAPLSMAVVIPLALPFCSRRNRVAATPFLIRFRSRHPVDPFLTDAQGMVGVASVVDAGQFKGRVRRRTAAPHSPTPAPLTPMEVVRRMEAPQKLP